MTDIVAEGRTSPKNMSVAFNDEDASKKGKTQQYILRRATISWLSNCCPKKGEATIVISEAISPEITTMKRLL